MFTTPLHSSHIALKAKMIDFGGWEMPLHYGSQIEEHHQVRRDAGMFDVSHMLGIDIEGEAAAAFLLRTLANNIQRLRQPGKALYSCMLNEEGGVLDDLIAYFLGEGRYRLVVNAATAQRDLAWLESQRPESGLSIVPRRDLAIIAVQGPNAREKVWRVRPELRTASEKLAPFSATESEECFIARTGYTGEDGFEMMVPAAQAEPLWAKLGGAGVTPAGLGARDTLRLEAGLNLYGQDMDESVTPLESGLSWTVDLVSERDFSGKQALLNRAPRAQLLGMVLLERGVLRAHQKVVTAAGEGQVTSGSFSPTLNLSIALARVPVGTAEDELVNALVRDRMLPARTVKLPFVRQGKNMIDPAALQSIHKESR
jgi:aminomethyltransferase